jgi:hypothetical protein
MNLNQFFITLSGDDYKVIDSLSPKVRSKFITIGVLVCFVFLLCLVSSYFTYTKLFQDYFIGIPIAIFFAYMFTNIYLLFLYTLNKNSFPEYNECSSKSKFEKVVRFTAKNSSRLVSLFFRLMFVSFIAIVISKPIELLFFTLPISKKIENYKSELIQQNKKKIDELSYEKITSYRNEINKIITMRTGSDTLYYSIQITQIENFRLKEHENIEAIVNKSNFYVQGIVILMKYYPQSWWISLLTIAIFLSPAFIKNLMTEQNEYYAKKIKMDRALVENDYFKFKHSYNVIMYKKYGQNYLWDEQYEDAPFNTIRKTDKRYFKMESDLLKDIYGSSSFIFEEREDEII